MLVEKIPDAFRRVLCAAVSVAAIGVPWNAQAQEVVGEHGTRETIVVIGERGRRTVSGTKSQAPLIETPQSITIIDNEELTRRNALTINQAVGYVAGVAANQRGTLARTDLLTIRGFNPGVYLDGMRLLAGPYSTPQIDFNRIDRIDIVKGPASVLYGNSTPGGMVNLVSKIPESETFGRIDLQLGNFETYRAVADVNSPIDTDGRILGRIVGGWQKSDGLQRDTTYERYHISPMVRFVPDARTSMTLIGTYQRTPSAGTFTGVLPHGSVLPNPLGTLPRDFNLSDPAYERFDYRMWSVSSLFRHEFNDALSAGINARYQSNTLHYRQLALSSFATTGTGAARQTDYGTVVRSAGGADEAFDTLTIDTRLGAKVTTGPVRHDLMIGIDYQNIAGDNVQHFTIGQTGNPVTNVPNLSIFTPRYGIGLPSSDLRALSPAHVDARSKRDQTGLYVQDQAAIGRLRLIASARYDWYDQTSINKNPVTNSRTPVTRLSQTAFTSRLGALYETAVGFAPYISYSESFEPQAGTTFDGTAFEPVTGRQYEAGIKYQPRGLSALFTLGAYDLRRQKVPVGDPRAGTAGIPTNAQIQIGEVRVRGVEIEGRGELFPGFDMVLAGSYTDAIITQGVPAVAPSATSSGTPTTTGTRQLGTPKWLASSFLSYDFGRRSDDASMLGGLTIGAGVRHVGRTDGTTTLAVVNGISRFQRFSVDRFTLFDGLVSYRLERLLPALHGVSLSVNATNMLDRKHVATCFFNNLCYYGEARSVIGSLRMSF
ncbi:iron complex outermembrane receptor protein [Sphingomonas sp. PP-CC-3G-468]|nr:iron complex outermembrane receptor protein [Sphingomonas sp. PP-CC-3G-468]